MNINTLSLSFTSRVLIFFFSLATIGLTLFNAPLFTLLSSVLHREGSSHGVFIPIFSGYLLWRRIEKIKSLPLQVNLLSAVGFLLIGSILFFLNKNTPYFLVTAILSFLCIAGGSILLLFGSAVFKETAFPLFLLAAMIPIPKEIYSSLAEIMRQISTWGSVIVSKALGVPVFRDGYNITLPNKKMVVEIGCSGMRYLLSYFFFSIFYASLFKQTTLGRMVVVLGSLPLAIIAGIARLSVIFVSVYYINPILGDPQPHIFLSWVVFALFLFGAIVVDLSLSNIREKAKS